METTNNNIKSKNDISKVKDIEVLGNFGEISNNEILSTVSDELENGGKQNIPGARFNIGDRVRMKHDGQTGTISRVWEGYNGFSYEVTRDEPVEGLESGSKMRFAFPQESGIEPLNPLQETSDITDNIMPEWCKNGQKVLYKGEVCEIECAPKKEYEHMGECIICNSENHAFFVKWAELTPCNNAV